MSVSLVGDRTRWTSAARLYVPWGLDPARRADVVRQARRGDSKTRKADHTVGLSAVAQATPSSSVPDIQNEWLAFAVVQTTLRMSPGSKTVQHGTRRKVVVVTVWIANV